MARGGRSVPVGGRAGVPVGQPHADRAPPAGPRGRHLGGPARTHARFPFVAFRPGPGRARPRAGHRAAAGELLQALPGLPPGDHRTGHRGHPHGPGGDQRLPADHRGLQHRVEAVPPGGRPRSLARGARARDARGDAPHLHRDQQRRVPLRFRGLAGGLRVRVRAVVDGHGLGRGTALRPALPHGRSHHRGGRALVHHPRTFRPGVREPLQGVPEQAHGDAQPVGLRARSVPDPGLR